MTRIEEQQRSESDFETPFDRIHPDRIDDKDEIAALLERARVERVEFRRGMNRRIDPEIARIEEIGPEAISLRTLNFEQDSRNQVFLNFLVDGKPHFLSAPLIDRGDKGRLRIGVPSVVYLAERRDHARRPPGPDDGHTIELALARTDAAQAEVVDVSAEGIGVVARNSSVPKLNGETIRVRFLDGRRSGDQLFAQVKQQQALQTPGGWTRIGLGLSAVAPGEPIRWETLDTAVPSSLARQAKQRLMVAAAVVQVGAGRVRKMLLGSSPTLPKVRTVEYHNAAGEHIRGIVDSWGDTRGATAVVIPPAWGRTKETLMPLAASLVAGFRAAREPIVVLRFDGIRKRGESFNDASCRELGRDHHRFTFSQGFRDIQATLDFLERSPEFGPRSNVLVSFSAASIESRRAAALDPRIDGWVSVVGAPDLQSMMRVISGGVDYALGMERGVKFGLQEILGIEVDMDHAGLDAFQHSLVYLEDARSDMAKIDVPVTWIHGRHDAWMDSDRVLDALSRGDTSKRRFIEVPTGHMLKTSTEALATFGLVVGEVGRMALGRSITPALPNLAGLELRRQSERRRLNAREQDLRSFWKDYLVGRDETIGIEMMTSITPYRDLMCRQVEELKLSEGDVVADLGSGTGAFLRHILLEGPRPARVVEVDYVRAGLERGRSALSETPGARLAVDFLECDLDSKRHGAGIPLRSESVDAILAALLVSYVSEPAELLSEIHRVVRPGGRVVVSCLRRDADMSKLYRDGIVELRSGQAMELLGAESAARIDELARGYLNQASRLLDYEEEGTFRFWDPDELEAMIERAGFRLSATTRSLGSPPQAVIVSCVRR